MADIRPRLVEILSKPGVPAIEAFLRHWHGAELPPEGPAGELPGIVRRLISAQRGHPSIIRQNGFVLDPDGRADRGLRYFYVENQGNDAWAVADGAGDDSPVWARKAHDSHLTLEAEPLARFLVQVVVFESVWSAPCLAAAATVSPAELDRIVGPLTPLDLAAWRWPGAATWLYAGDDVIAVVMANPPRLGTGPSDRFSVWVAALRPDGLGYLAGIAAIDWDVPPPGQHGQQHASRSTR